MIDDAKLLGILGQLEQESYGFASGQLAEQRAYAIDRYLAQPYGDEIDGRSQVVDTGLRDTVEWVMPQVLRVFLSGDEVVKFTPTSFEDEPAAKQETQYVNHVILEKNDAFNVFSTWFRDACLSKNGYVKAYWEERSDVMVESYKGLTDDTLAIISADPEVEIADQQSYPDPSYSPPPMPAAQAMSMGQGPMNPPPAPMLHDVKVRRVQKTGYVKVDNVPPEEIRVHQSTRTIGLSDVLYIQHSSRKTISELRQYGYDIPDDIAPGAENMENTAIEVARDRFQDSDELLNDGNSEDPATKRVWFIEEWARIDYDEDGVAELRKICRIGDDILANDETDLVPFACVTPVIFPHRHIGIGYDDLCDQPSKVKTAIQRSFLDNLYLANNGRYGVDVNKVNVDDLLISRPGGMVRVNGDPATALMPIVHPTTGPAALQGLEWADSWREQSTGVSPDLASMSADVMNNATATGISQAVSAGQGRVEAVTRSFASGVKELFSIVHALTLKNATRGEMVKLNQSWVAVDPREWVKRTGMTITVGLGTGTKESRIQQLMTLGQMQMQGLPIGIATPANLYHSGARLAEEMGYKNVDEFWTDPSKNPPQPKQPDPIVQAEQIKSQTAMQTKQMDLQAQQSQLQSKAQVDAQRAQQDFVLQQSNDQRQAQLDSYKMEMEREKMEREFQLRAWEKQQDIALQQWQTQFQAGVQTDMKSREFQFQDAQSSKAQTQKDDGSAKAMAPVLAHIKAMSDAINAPKRVVRGPDGRVMGVESGGKTRNVVRDQNGRVEGLQ